MPVSENQKKAFLYPDKFIKFYDEMGDFVSEAKGKSVKKLHELQTALSFTRLELGRDHGFDAYGYAKRNGKRYTASSPSPKMDHPAQRTQSIYRNGIL